MNPRKCSHGLQLICTYSTEKESWSLCVISDVELTIKEKYFATSNSSTSLDSMLMNSSHVANEWHDVLPLPELPCREMCFDRNGSNFANNSNVVTVIWLFKDF